MHIVIDIKYLFSFHVGSEDTMFMFIIVLALLISPGNAWEFIAFTLASAPAYPFFSCLRHLFNSIKRLGDVINYFSVHFVYKHLSAFI